MWNEYGGGELLPFPVPFQLSNVSRGLSGWGDIIAEKRNNLSGGVDGRRNEEAQIHSAGGGCAALTGQHRPSTVERAMLASARMSEKSSIVG